MKTELEFKTEALATFLTKGFTVAGDIVTPVDNSEEVPSKSDWDAKIVELKAEYDALEYARNRASEYPSITNVVVALAEKAEGRSAMWDEITAQRLDVKSKYPKP